MGLSPAPATLCPEWTVPLLECEAQAYVLPSATGGTGQTVAIVDAFDNPNAEADLAVYRAQFGLPACTTANGCFRKVNQNGNASPAPAADMGWAEEISLDIDMVSAVCPNCNILLVEANSNNNNDLFTSVNTAAGPLTCPPQAPMPPLRKPAGASGVVLARIVLRSRGRSGP